MTWLVQFIGLILFLTYFGLGIIWLESPISDVKLQAFTFSALTIYLPFIVYGLFKNKIENYLKVVAVFSSSFASFLSTSIFFLYTYDLFSLKLFWSLQIIVWTIVILLIVFSSIAEKNVRD